MAKKPDPAPAEKAPEDMTLEELNALSDALDEERAVLNERKREVHAARVERAAAEHAAYYGLTAYEYDEAKRRAAANGEDFVKVLAQTRRDAARRNVQVARADAASVGAKAQR